MTRRAYQTVILALLLGCQPTTEGFLEIEGWSPQSSPAIYGPEELWQAINGAADVFMSYGFELLTAQQYSADDLTVTVNVYDMGTALNAFGIYRTEVPPELSPLDVGTEAVLSPPYQCLLLKDRYYVKVEAYEGDIDETSGRGLVVAIARALPGVDEVPAAIAALPAEGMVAGSARYTKQDLFGLSELDEVVHAVYTDESEGEYRTLVKLPAAGETIDGAWSELADRWQQTELDGRPVLYREVPYEGFTGVARSDVGLIGVAGCESTEQLFERIQRLAR